MSNPLLSCPADMCRGFAKNKTGTIAWHDVPVKTEAARFASSEQETFNPSVLDRPLSSAYIQSLARALRAFSSWLYENRYADTNVLRPLNHLRGNIWRCITDAEPSPSHEPKSHGWIEMTTRYVASGVCHRHDGQAKGQRDTEQADSAWVNTGR